MTICARHAHHLCRQDLLGSDIILLSESVTADSLPLGCAEHGALFRPKRSIDLIRHQRSFLLGDSIFPYCLPRVSMRMLLFWRFQPKRLVDAWATEGRLTRIVSAAGLFLFFNLFQLINFLLLCESGGLSAHGRVNVIRADGIVSQLLFVIHLSLR